MIEWFTWAQAAVAVTVGLLCVILGFVGRPPADITLGATLLVELLLIGQLVTAIVAPSFGNTPSGSALEFYLYLGSALLLPPVAIFWALVERNRWSTVVLGVVSLAVAVMIFRMHEIWFVQSL